MAKTTISRQKTRLTLLAGLLLLAQPAIAQTDVGGPKRILYPMALVGVGTASEFQDALAFDLDISGWFRAISGQKANETETKLTIEPGLWKNQGVFGVCKFQVKQSGANVVIDARLFEVEKGANPVLSRTYRGKAADIRTFAHKWAGEVVKYHTGEDSFFGSKIVLSVKRGKSKQIVVVDHDGKNSRTVTRNRALNVLPSWNPAGNRIAFTSYMRRNPDLYTVSAGGGRPKALSRRQGMNTGASYSPDGSQVAVTLSRDGNPEIYILRASSGAIIRRLTNSPAIDTSPTWSPDGSEIAFVSDRQGGPQIFVMPSSGGAAKRVSFNGSYNTTPVFSPRKGKRIVAYTTRDGGKYDIVTLNLDTQQMSRVTQNQGNNEEPTFSPNGRAIAFVSKRKGGNGLYISNAEGTGKQYLIFKGRVGSADWGPAQ